MPSEITATDYSISNNVWPDEEGNKYLGQFIGTPEYVYAVQVGPTGLVIDQGEGNSINLVEGDIIIEGDDGIISTVETENFNKSFVPIGHQTQNIYKFPSGPAVRAILNALSDVDTTFYGPVQGEWNQRQVDAAIPNLGEPEYRIAGIGPWHEGQDEVAADEEWAGGWFSTKDEAADGHQHEFTANVWYEVRFTSTPVKIS